MTLEMFVRMVVLVWFHSVCIESLSELSFECDEADGCVRICCGSQELELDGSCEALQTSEMFSSFRNFTFPEVDVRFGKPCDMMHHVDDEDWFFEVKLDSVCESPDLKCDNKLTSRAEEFVRNH